MTFDDVRVAITVGAGSRFASVRFTAYNEGESDAALDPSGVLLLDASRTVLRRLEPHEAANIVLSLLKDVPLYRPKYVVTSSGSATATGSGGLVTVSASSTTVVQEDAAAAVVHSMASSFTRGFNQGVQGVADEVYNEGIAGVLSVPPRASVTGSLYFAVPDKNKSLLFLRVYGTEIVFQR